MVAVGGDSADGTELAKPVWPRAEAKPKAVQP